MAEETKCQLTEKGRVDIASKRVELLVKLAGRLDHFLALEKQSNTPHELTDNMAKTVNFTLDALREDYVTLAKYGEIWG